MIKNIKKHLNLTITLVLFVFGVITASSALGGGLVFLLHKTGLLKHININGKNPWIFLSGLLFICTLVGTSLTALLSKKALMPIRKVIDATHKIAQGDFSARVNISGINELEELSQSFNKMAQELSNTETLRSDFVNSFSHEFKTPIVSVRGFAKLLKEGNLSEEEKREYLDIIITESERLAQLSTNVLNLTKYENIEIVTDRTLFRLDEQIRKAVLITQQKWCKKNIAMNVELDEITFNGNEDLTQQIWLNLIENAIKYSNENGIISIRLLLWNGKVRFSIQDNGLGMDEQVKAHIFEKFYQGDRSHSKLGNGLGLAIVKRIAELCGGSIEVKSEIGRGSTFIVMLPDGVN